MIFYLGIKDKAEGGQIDFRQSAHADDLIQDGYDVYALNCRDGPQLYDVVGFIRCKDVNQPYSTLSEGTHKNN